MATVKKPQPRNRLWNPNHDPAYDFRVIAEFTQRFPHLQFLWFYRNPSFFESGVVLHSIKFRADRDGLRAVGIPRPRRDQSYGSDYRPGYGAPVWSWYIDARCRLPYVVQFWMMDEGCGNNGNSCLSESHPLGWLVPARLESTPFDGDLDSIIWGESVRAAA